LWLASPSGPGGLTRKFAERLHAVKALPQKIPVAAELEVNRQRLPLPDQMQVTGRVTEPK